MTKKVGPSFNFRGNHSDEFFLCHRFMVINTLVNTLVYAFDRPLIGFGQAFSFVFSNIEPKKVKTLFYIGDLRFLV